MTDDSAPEFVRWQDSYEASAAAEAVYIEHELQARGDGMWRPWAQLERHQQEHWERVATAVLRTINQRRGQALIKPRERMWTSGGDA